MFERSSKQNIFSTGNETFDKFLGGGLLNKSLNLFERQGPSSKILETVWNSSLASSTLVGKNNFIYVNFNPLKEVTSEQILSFLPMTRKVSSKLLYKDVQGKSAAAQIKIAWRYSSRDLSPSDNILKIQQVDFGVSLTKDISEPSELGVIRVVNIKDNFTIGQLIVQLENHLNDLKKDGCAINILIGDLLNPFSPIIDDPQQLCRVMYILRCFARQKLDRGVILTSFDINQCETHSELKQQLYNLSDCVVSFYSYETGENKLTGYKNIDGTLEYIKVPKINSYGFHFQRELSDYGYRFTKNHRFFVVDELSLPPLHDDEEDVRVKKPVSIAPATYRQKPLEQAGPLEDFRDVAQGVLTRKL